MRNTILLLHLFIFSFAGLTLVAAALPQAKTNPHPDTVDAIPVTSATGITYRVQVMALQKPVDESYFSLKWKINLYVKAETDGVTTKYTVGNYADYKEAARLRDQLKKRGIKGAFIVCYNSGVRVPCKRP